MATETTTAAANTPAPAVTAGGAEPEHVIPPTAIFVAERCYLRRWEDSDAEAQAEMVNDPEVVRYLRSRIPSPYALADAQEYIAYCKALPPPALSFGVFTLRGELAGSIGLEPPKGDRIYAGTRELGYLASRKFWGRGIMTEAVRELTRWAFATVPDLLRIEAGVFEPNRASQRVLEKAGFVREGKRRLAAVKNGEQMDEVVFGLIRTDIQA
ncbi:acetyltransferase [Xylaria digitata]|nr:acetyltransferase [Xylaria digitata]